jgi:hypothetical protein
MTSLGLAEHSQRASICIEKVHCDKGGCFSEGRRKWISRLVYANMLVSNCLLPRGAKGDVKATMLEGKLLDEKLD